MACHFCPLKLSPEYVMKNLKEHYGSQMRSLYRSGRTIYRLNGSPRYEVRESGTGRVPTLVVDVPTSDTKARKPIYTFAKITDTNPTDSVIRANIAKWFATMSARYYGNTTVLPNQKPDGGGADLLS